MKAQDMSDYACHPCAILSDDSFSVFAKYSTAPDAARQFEIEQAGLEYLAEKAGVLIPMPVAVVPLDEGMLFILEGLQAIERGPEQWRQIGRTLARIHKVKSDSFGFRSDNFFGPLPQDNSTLPDWPAFFAERRLQPLLRLAVDSGNLPPSMALQVETMIERLPDLCGPQVTPTLLHGDAQQNNFISTARGTYVIDPAIYYGHPELDLAFVDYFQPVPRDLFDGYREELPIDPGFDERRGLWRLPGYLAAVAVEGQGYLGMLLAALQGY